MVEKYHLFISITFGSPCQNLSNIGKREGLTGSKSNLFYQALRIIEEMRCATNGVYPAVAVWENVLGAFSSNNRMNFKAVLESFANTEIPMPVSRVWSKAGMVRGNNVDICWRLLDAQYWGRPTLPQRRKRIFLVADFRGKRSKEILFKSRDLQSFPTSCGESSMSSSSANRISFKETGRKIPIVHPFRERSMRSAAKEKDRTRFLGSF
ncbi:DNA cytosine methyltransferase [Oceanobacillus jeddahense]|uniref:DNA cytosine methyltransferase n=1 Tax=Oceanobacillus jeddahense TaxID=1462527 RepID=UPI0021CC0877|nr:DNA cytosine methyltransferase [Oceanobacillus jeddahense]